MAADSLVEQKGSGLRVHRLVSARSLLLLVFCVAIPLIVKASGEDELGNSKCKLQLNGWISSPTGYFNGQNDEGYFDPQRDLGFGNYVTFTGKADWRFKRKHHLFFASTPIVSSRTTTLARTIDWQGQTFDDPSTSSKTERSSRSLAKMQLDGYIRVTLLRR